MCSILFECDVCTSDRKKKQTKNRRRRSRRNTTIQGEWNFTFFTSSSIDDWIYMPIRSFLLFLCVKHSRWYFINYYYYYYDGKEAKRKSEWKDEKIHQPSSHRHTKTCVNKWNWYVDDSDIGIRVQCTNKRLAHFILSFFHIFFFFSLAAINIKIKITTICLLLMKLETEIALLNFCLFFRCFRDILLWRRVKWKNKMLNRIRCTFGCFLLYQYHQVHT